MLALILILSKWLGLLGMVITGILGLMSPRAGDALVHYSLGMISTFLFAAAQTMTVYYFIGMSRAILRAAERHRLDDAVRTEAKSVKRRVSPRGYLVLLLATATLIAGGGTLFGTLPSWLHYSLAIATLLSGVYTSFGEFTAFRLNAALYDRVATMIEAGR
jgi:hypothetical protein